MTVEYKRLKDFTALEVKEIKNLSESAFKKFQRDFKNSKLIVDIHRFEKAGDRCKYSVHLRLDDPSLILTAEQADWDLVRALHKTISNMEEEIKHKYKKETKRGGPRTYPV